MAIRTNGTNGNYLSRTTGMPNWGNFTMLGFTKISVDRNNYSTFYQIGGGGKLIGVQTNTDGTTVLQFADNGAFSGVSISGGSFSVGTWYGIGSTMSGYSFKTFIYNLATGAVTSTASTATGNYNTGTIATIKIGDDEYSEPLNGCFSSFKLWDTVLSDAEIETQMGLFSPVVRLNNLIGFFPMYGASKATSLFDASGGTTLSETGSAMTVEDGPPVSWGASPFYVINPTGPGQIGRPISAVSHTVWVPNTGTSLTAAINEEIPDDTNFIFANSPGIAEIKIDPLFDPVKSGGHKVRYRVRGLGRDLKTLRVRLKEGDSTVIAEWTHIFLPGYYQTFEQSLTSEQADSITNYTNLRLQYRSYADIYGWSPDPDPVELVISVLQKSDTLTINGSSSDKTLTFGAPITAGSRIVIGFSVKSNTANSGATMLSSFTMTGVTFNKDATHFHGGGNASQGVHVWSGIVGTGGATTCTFSMIPNTSFTATAVEISGGSYAGFDGSWTWASTNTMTHGPITSMPSENGIVFLVDYYDSYGTANIGFNTPTDWTVIHANNVGNNDTGPGWFGYRLTSGESTIPSVALTSTNGPEYGQAGVLIVYTL